MKTVLDGNQGINWLVSNVSDLQNTMLESFKTKEWSGKINGIVNSAIDGLRDKHPLLVNYFRPYLNDHLQNDFETFGDIAQTQGTVAIDSISETDAIASVKSYVKGKVPASLVIGGYSSGKYPGMDKHIYKNKRLMTRFQASSLLSLAAALNETMFGTQATKFFKCASYQELMSKVSSDSDLFKLDMNKELISLSKYVDDGSDNLKVNWDVTKSWLQGDVSQAIYVIKAFVRT